MKDLERTGGWEVGDMTIEEAKMLARSRGFDIGAFDFAVDMLNTALDIEGRNMWQDVVTRLHWANFLTEDEMESVK